ncbi:glycosyltransferase family 4 protein [Neolewinella persica]|uniref:glycosyltransferase family 4 protein n=1 Tax=Neolewinella persica TaxID=70998 RepID=UPI00036F88E8|nr:glycosyltransferase family 4 protein [Neolewinella persica]
MRIVFTVTNDLAQDQRMDRICRSLTRAGHEVTLVGRELPTSQPLPETPYRQFRIRCKNLAGKRFYAEYNYRLWKTIRQWEYDAICSVDLDTLLAGVSLTRAEQHKLVFDAHEWFSETPEVINRPLIRGVWRGLGKALVPRTDARYTVAPMLAKQLEEDYGVPFKTVRNLPVGRSAAQRDEVPMEGAVGPITTGRKVLLYQGMFNPGRGLKTAIEALALLPDFELWLVGDGPELGALRRCSEELGCGDRVWFAGFRPPAELPAITARAWLGLNLLDAVSPSYYFSLANKALDYIQAGLPSVQMNFPEYHGIHQEYHCFLLIDHLAPVDLTAAIRQLAADQAHFARLQAGCARAGEELVWEREEEVLLGIWERVQRATIV